MCVVQRGGGAWGWGEGVTCVKEVEAACAAVAIAQPTAEASRSGLRGKRSAA